MKRLIAAMVVTAIAFIGDYAVLAAHHIFFRSPEAQIRIPLRYALEDALWFTVGLSIATLLGYLLAVSFLRITRARRQDEAILLGVLTGLLCVFGTMLAPGPLVPWILMSMSNAFNPAHGSILGSIIGPILASFIATLVVQLVSDRLVAIRAR